MAFVDRRCRRNVEEREHRAQASGLRTPSRRAVAQTAVLRRHARAVAVRRNDDRISSCLRQVSGSVDTADVRQDRVVQDQRGIGSGASENRVVRHIAVVAHTDVPIGIHRHAGPGGVLIKLRHQRDQILLRLQTRARTRDFHVERAICPDHVVRQKRHRQRSAQTIGARSQGVSRVAVVEARRADHRRRQRLHQVRRIDHRHQARRLRNVRRIWIQAQRVLGILRVGRRHAEGRRRSRVDRAQRLEQHAGRGGRVIGHDGVVHHGRLQRVFDRHARTIPARHVVRDDVIGNGYSIPLGRIHGKRTHLGTIDLLQAQSAAAAALGAVTHNQVRVDNQPLTRSIADARRAILVGKGPAFLAVGKGAIRVRTNDCNTTTVRGQGRVHALVKENPVVRDAAVPARAAVRQGSAVASAQVAGDPVVVNDVVVRASADGDTAGTRGRA